MCIPIWFIQSILCFIYIYIPCCLVCHARFPLNIAPHYGYVLMRFHTEVYKHLSKKRLLFSLSQESFVRNPRLVEDYNFWNKSVNATPCEFNHIRRMIRIFLVGKVLIRTRSGDVWQTSHYFITKTWFLAAGTWLAREKRWSDVKCLLLDVGFVNFLPSSQNSIIFISRMKSHHPTAVYFFKPFRAKLDPGIHQMPIYWNTVFLMCLAILMLTCRFLCQVACLSWWCHSETVLLLAQLVFN